MQFLFPEGDVEPALLHRETAGAKQQGSRGGLWQQSERWLGQGWVQHRQAEWSKGRSSCRESMGRKDRTDKQRSREKSRGECHIPLSGKR